MTALSSCEAKYYSLTEATKEVLWFQLVLKEVNYHGVDVMPMVIHEDNRAAIELAKNPEFITVQNTLTSAGTSAGISKQQAKLKWSMCLLPTRLPTALPSLSTPSSTDILQRP